MQTRAYGIAHEIKNPLGGIRGAAQWMLREETPEEERREGTRLILREAERINGLVEKMRELGGRGGPGVTLGEAERIRGLGEKMLELGRHPPPPRPFPLLPVLREAEELIRT